MVERGTGTEGCILMSSSIETDPWMSQLQTPECSRAVQTQFNYYELLRHVVSVGVHKIVGFRE